MRIHDKKIGPDHPCYIIAEAGVNHNGDMDIAHKLIDEAAACGADAVKFQAFITEEIVTAAAPKAGYQYETVGGEDTQFNMLKELELSAEQQESLASHCQQCEITYVCTPYDVQSAAMLDQIGVAAYKIASTDTTNTPFLRQVADFGRPTILSTGMATLSEVEDAVLALEKVGDQLAILHCTSEYPAPPEESNLAAMHTLRLAFQVPIGFSDHTSGVGVSPYAVVAGANIVEKHFSLDRSMVGPDHRASIEPPELTQLVEDVRMVEGAMGNGIKKPTSSERANMPAIRKSIVTTRAITAGELLNIENTSIKRPGTGLAPKMYDIVLGAKAKTDLESDRLIALEDLDFGPGA